VRSIKSRAQVSRGRKKEKRGGCVITISYAPFAGPRVVLLRKKKGGEGNERKKGKKKGEGKREKFATYIMVGFRHSM